MLVSVWRLKGSTRGHPDNRVPIPAQSQDFGQRWAVDYLPAQLNVSKLNSYVLALMFIRVV